MVLHHQRLIIPLIEEYIGKDTNPIYHHTKKELEGHFLVRTSMNLENYQ